MTWNQKSQEPVSDDEFEQMDTAIADHFDRVRARLDEELEKESSE